ncbi:MAG TPA: hypothetical protein VF175_15175 [Lacipirellula sp.]
MTERRIPRSSGVTKGSLESRLAAYMAATGAATALASTADAAVVGNTTPQAFGVNGNVNVDFNSDGQTDFQIDHDRVNLNGTDLDYLQIDKNDVNGETNPLAFDPGPNASFTATPFMDGASPRNDANEAAYLIDGVQGSYPAALPLGTSVGPASAFDFQEGDNFQGSGKHIRANRLIDEDATQIDQQLGGQPPSGVHVPTSGPNWVGLGGEVRYLGLKMDLNNTAVGEGLTAFDYNYGWIGVQITNEADATGVVTGWAYETEKGVDILAGDAGPVVANADYDDDGDVDGGDLLLWQQTLGDSVTSGTGADGSSNGVVDGADLDLWETQFGGGAALAAGHASAAAVPEPGSLLMAALSGMLLVGWFLLKRGSRRLVPPPAPRSA